MYIRQILLIQMEYSSAKHVSFARNIYIYICWSYGRANRVSYISLLFLTPWYKLTDTQDTESCYISLVLVCFRDQLIVHQGSVFTTWKSNLCNNRGWRRSWGENKKSQGGFIIPYHQLNVCVMIPKELSLATNSDFLCCKP